MPRSHDGFARWAAGTIALLVSLAAVSTPADAQYFGRNKVQYESLDFRIAPTDHFDIFFYPAESLATADAARMAERWYQRHSALLNHTFERNPLIFYADPPDFHQSNVIEGMLGQGTGGVTEGLRDRVIMPFTGIYAETDHVLGHELVHVFQYRIAQSSSSGPNSLGAIPLWLIEGMAEYLSLGRSDPNTSMWLRDALRRNDLPTIRQLNSGRYFPYRYGQALWAYIGGTWGDAAVNRVFRAAVSTDWETAFRSILGLTTDSLSKQWHAAIRSHYTDLASRATPAQTGRQVIPMDEHQNIAPAFSPDGRRVAFFSSRGLFDIDLFVADAASGRVEDRLTSVDRERNFESLSFISSSPTWSPDGRRIAFAVYNEGDNEIQIVDADDGGNTRRLQTPGIGAISDPAWSPDGRYIAFTGLKGGISDLYVYDLTTNTTAQLTDDREAQLHPAWRRDGAVIAVSTDRGDSTDFAQLRYGPLRLALVDVRSREVTLVPRTGGGKQINPQFTPDGRSLYYVSDRDGVSNIYLLDLATQATRQITNVATGISGITATSPALSVASGSGDLVFTVFDRQRFAIRSMAAADAGGVVADAAPTALAGVLPPGAALATGTVDVSLRMPRAGLPDPVGIRATRAYRSGLSLHYVASPSIGVATGGFGGTAVGGGIALGFSDMLGNHVLGTSVNAPGNIRDISVDALYLNRSRRFAWGIEAYHIPIASVFTTASPTTFNIDGDAVNGVIYTQEFQRVYYNSLQLIGQYPRSSTKRWETSVGVQHVSFGVEIDSIFAIGNQVVGDATGNRPGGPALTFATATAAYVHDNSFFGFTSPIAGSRSRAQISPYFGSLTYQTALLDYRRYAFVRPVTFAMRGLLYGRFGRDAEDGRLQPLFLGQPSFVRGYDASSFSVSECTAAVQGNDSCPQFSRLIGSRLGVVNAELRIPVFGSDALGLFNVPFLPLEIAPFADGGVAWTQNDNPDLRFDRATAERVPVFSAGVTARANLLGALILEVYWVRPFQRPGRNGYVGFQIMPGW
jgi:Tol biopolymer transport system component